MLQAGTIAFLKELKENNNKPWFDANRDRYTLAKEDFEQFIGTILAKLAVAEPGFGEQKAKDCIFRIFRDVRFSKDKSPYKPNFGAFFSKGGKKYPGAGYYLHLEPGGNSFIGGGLWMPETPILKAIRQEIDYNLADFKAIVEDKKFVNVFPEVSGEKSVKVPQGYTSDNPAAEYLKLKSFTVHHSAPDELLTSKSFVDKTVDVFTTMKPFIDFLNKGIVMG